MPAPRVTRVLKEDALGRVERIGGDGGPWVRRVAAGGRIPGSGAIARRLCAREARALRRLAGVERVPRVLDRADLAALPGLDGRAPEPRAVLVRSWIEGRPLWETDVLAADYFDELERLVRELHAHGVCHNDLHKEQNLLVTPAGLPAILDFQLASVHTQLTRAFRVRAQDDLRHVHKHLRRYVRDGRGPEQLAARLAAAPVRPRSRLAWAWRRGGKPLYNLVTRRLLRRADGEPRRSSAGPWPRWTGPAAGSAGSGPAGGTDAGDRREAPCGEGRLQRPEGSLS